MATDVAVPEREGEYGTRVVAVEPGGIEHIPLSERHGSPYQQFLTWVSPNMEFATIFVGVIGVAFFGASFWAAALAIVVGTALGSITQGILASWGPRLGIPQMVQGRAAFGFWGNLIPAILMSLGAGIGWFAVNSVSAALALDVLLHIPFVISLLIVVLLQVGVAFFGHNLVHIWERYAFIPLVVVFVIAAVIIFLKANFGLPADPKGLGNGTGFILTAAAAFGYACGWNPYASDYSRYLPPDTSPRKTGLSAGLGIFVSCVFLELVGAALATVHGTNFDANPTAQFSNALPEVVAVLALLAIALGGISANVLNIYSGAMAFLTVGIRLGARQRRAIVALVFGAIGFVVALIGGLSDLASTYDNFLLVIAYWIAPWFGIVFTDYVLRRGHFGDGAIFYDRGHNPWSGATAFVIATVVSVALFSNETAYVGVVPRHWPAIGDLTFVVGFLLAVIIYGGLNLGMRRKVEEGPAPARTAS
ncbi:MAG: cytosine permease [Candidatus Dormibacteraeota bacterium]|nr:cytosine permease [Candidatus Dormibacteraeota bacterium]MBO0745061.1 cytosine permease [Candidatus Dormibacteraeota bacterium]